VPAGIQGDVPRQYAACVMHLDDAVGRIVAALEKSGQRQNTLLVFTSDNGGSTAENNDTKYPLDDHPSGKLTGNNKPLRGQKGQLYEGGIRVPTIVSWPGKLKPGKIDTPAHITDWMPTFCSLAAAPVSGDLKWDGADIGPVLTGKGQLPERPLYWAAPGFRSRAVRVGNWKLVASGAEANRKLELFNLAADPHESADLASQQPAKVKELLAVLDQVSARDRDAVAKD
jgi:arylsulfatase A-like enzyme